MKASYNIEPQVEAELLAARGGQRLLLFAEWLVARHGLGGAAKQVGVDHRTLKHVLDTQKLTRRTTAALQTLLMTKVDPVGRELTASLENLTERVRTLEQLDRQPAPEFMVPTPTKTFPQSGVTRAAIAALWKLSQFLIWIGSRRHSKSQPRELPYDDSMPWLTPSRKRTPSGRPNHRRVRGRRRRRQIPGVEDFAS